MLNEKSILFIINDLDLGGAGKMMKYVINISSAWFKNVSLIEVYAKEASKEIPERVKAFPLGIEVNGVFGFRYKIIKSIRDIVKREKPDLVLTFVSDMCVNTRIATLGLNTIVCSADRGDPYTETFPWTILIPWAFSNSDYCFFQLDKARDFYSTKVQKKSFVIPNVFVAKSGNTPFSGERNKTIVSAGRFVVEKGYDVLIKVFAKIHEKHPEYTMTIYGDGPFLDQYHKLAQELGVDDLITYPGYVKDVAASVREDGIFVLPSRYEGIPNSLIEALSVGIPCVSTDCTPGGPMFLTKGGRNGLIVPIDDVEAMTNAVLRIIENPQLAKELETKGPEIVNELKDEVISKMWLEAFNKIFKKMINTKKELKFYIMADRIMNGFSARLTWKEKMSNFVLATPPIVKYIERMRKVSYYQHQSGLINKLRFYYNYHKYNKLSTLLGVFVAPDVCGYGLVIPHHGTLRIGGGNKIGNYAVIHTVSNMTASKVVAGDGLYMSVGCKVIGPLSLGNNVSIAANSVVNKSFGDNILLAGAPAKVVKEKYSTWYERDGDEFQKRINQVESLKKQMGL